MKTKILTSIIALLFLFPAITNAQDKYKLFVEKMGIETQIKAFGNQYIDKLSTEIEGLTTSAWQTIKAGIDYSSCIGLVEAVIRDHYTIEEIDKIFEQNNMLKSVNDTGEFIYSPKPEVIEGIYETSKGFGQTINFYVKEAIRNIKN
jgi:hypothetical protein